MKKSPAVAVKTPQRFPKESATLAEMRDLLIEVRELEDVKLRRLSLIERRLDELTTEVGANRRAVARLQRPVPPKPT